MGGKLAGIATVGIVVTVKRPQDEAAITIAPPASFGWTEEAAVSYSRHQYMTLPRGSVINIAITVEETDAPDGPAPAAG